MTDNQQASMFRVLKDTVICSLNNKKQKTLVIAEFYRDGKLCFCNRYVKKAKIGDKIEDKTLKVIGIVKYNPESKNKLVVIFQKNVEFSSLPPINTGIRTFVPFTHCKNGQGLKVEYQGHLNKNHTYTYQ